MAKRKSGHRNNGRGTLRIDREFESVGRIAMASGLTDKIAFRQVNDVLTRMHRAGRFDLLGAVKDGRVRPRHLLSLAQRLGPSMKVASLAVAEISLLEDSIEQWREKHAARSESGDGTLTRHERNIYNALLRVIGQADDQARPLLLVQELPRLAESYREKCFEQRQPQEWKHTRAYVARFLADVLGTKSELVSEARGMAPIRAGRKKQVGRPIPREALRELLASLAPDLRGVVRTMATTGMGPIEYFRDHSEVTSEGFVWIDGKKRCGRSRAVPFVCPLAARPFRVGAFRGRFEKAQLAIYGMVKYRHYDLRRTYAVALAKSGVPAIRHPHYLGHGPKTMTQLYQQEIVVTAEKKAELLADGELLRRFFALPERAL